jgi:hypothetical protein
VIVHRLSTRRRGAKNINDPSAQTDTPGRNGRRGKIPLHRKALFDPD